MSYTEVTNIILNLCQEATDLIDNLPRYYQRIIQNPEQKPEIIRELDNETTEWTKKCKTVLSNNGLLIEMEGFKNYTGISMSYQAYQGHHEVSDHHTYLSNRKDFLIKAAKEIENRKNEKEVIALKIDDIDNFRKIKDIDSNEVQKFAISAFLEDDIEEAFLEALGEPYKEMDSGSETRDLFTDKIIVGGQRLNTAIMFKGRGVKGPLSLDQCGSKGTQLLKLSKNNAAECFIVQHVNKIEPDVKETLFDLVRMNARFKKTYVCFIDGVDTARFLKSMNKNLEELKNKKTKRK